MSFGKHSRGFLFFCDHMEPRIRYAWNARNSKEQLSEERTTLADQISLMIRHGCTLKDMKAKIQQLNGTSV